MSETRSGGTDARRHAFLIYLARCESDELTQMGAHAAGVAGLPAHTDTQGIQAAIGPAVGFGGNVTVPVGIDGGGNARVENTHISGDQTYCGGDAVVKMGGDGGPHGNSGDLIVVGEAPSRAGSWPSALRHNPGHQPCHECRFVVSCAVEPRFSKGVRALAASKSKKPSKTDAIREQLAATPAFSNADVVEALKAKGVKVSGARVSQVRNASSEAAGRGAKKRGRRRAHRAAAEKRPRAAKTVGRGPTWTFPQHTLEDAIRIPQIIEEQNSGKPIPAADLCRAVGYRQSTDWRFLNLVRAAKHYNLVDAAGANAIVGLTDVGRDIVSPSSTNQRQEALLKAFRAVDDFKRVEEYYKGKRLPEDEFFSNTLVRDFGVPRERVAKFIEIFTKDLEYLKAFRATSEQERPATAEKSAEATTVHEVSSAVREYLDSCFVMMPFGGWFDKYYTEIYTPAIKEAGFEPMRADAIFTSGSVVEQVWEQIQKSKVLLADLTGKNPNVFYELGLAHAARKPVVFTSGSLDDVPFDLRHLRVVIYDVHEPSWSQKLAREITVFLKNARSEPEKSIPQPFRGEESNGGEEEEAE